MGREEERWIYRAKVRGIKYGEERNAQMFGEIQAGKEKDAEADRVK